MNTASPGRPSRLRVRSSVSKTRDSRVAAAGAAMRRMCGDPPTIVCLGADFTRRGGASPIARARASLQTLMFDAAPRFLARFTIGLDIAAAV
jgi:hypothetical protein